ncbi:hypothetical protein [Mycoplasma suis]|uniref:Uncharacterized protein n=1 Tax=Mycoplasma suis (strain Illinois) TaxID=768700 RepID=F0QRU4_MYCSL|nr:hypothetical protein [Mycoplasma suis]ADX98214.1 hypothetical protein MSU_0683 [Mycoplasma suis str. Illinois]
MQLKYKLIGSLIAFAGANSTAIPFVLKSNIVQDYFSPSPNNLSLSSLNTLSNSSTTSLGTDPKERIQFSENNSQYLELVNNSAQLNSQLTNIHLDNQEQLPALSDLSSELSQTGFAVAVKQIRREIKREGGASGVEQKQIRVVREALESLNNLKEDYVKAVSKVKKYRTDIIPMVSEIQEHEISENSLGRCVNNEKGGYYCFEDRTSKVTELNNSERKALKDFLKSYLELQERSEELVEKLGKGNRNIEATRNEEKKTEIKNILQKLKEIHWDIENEDILYKYKKKSESGNFGWGENWQENPFSALFDNEVEWKAHMFRIIENEKESREGAEEEKKKSLKESLKKIHDEIKLLVAVKLLEKMEQLGVTEVVEELTK